MRIWEKSSEDEFCGFNVVSTCFDTKRQLYKKYPSAKPTIKYIKSKGSTVLPEVDCTQLDSNKRGMFARCCSMHVRVTDCCIVSEALAVISSKVSDSEQNVFDRIIFNFPHLGHGISDTAQSVKLHQEFLRKFLESAHKVLASDGQLHIAVKRGEPYDLWSVPKLAVESGVR